MYEGGTTYPMVSWRRGLPMPFTFAPSQHNAISIKSADLPMARNHPVVTWYHQFFLVMLFTALVGVYGFPVGF